MTSTNATVGVFSRLKLALYFLTVAYFGLAVHANLRLHRVVKLTQGWNSTRLFHTFIALLLNSRTVAFGVLTFFIIFDHNPSNRAMIVLYTLPEFLILSVYILLYFHWLETFVFSHEQFFVTDKAKFRRRWKGTWAILTLLFYAAMTVGYIVLFFKFGSLKEDWLNTLEYAAGLGDLILPFLTGCLWVYWNTFALVGFPYKSEIARKKTQKVNHIVLLWSVGRLVRGAELLWSMSEEWEQTMDTVYLSMVTVAVLGFSEFLPLFFALDWGIVSFLLLGEESQHLLRGKSASTMSSVGLLRNEDQHDKFLLDADRMRFHGDPVQDNGFAFTQHAEYDGAKVVVKGFRLQFTDEEKDLLDDITHNIIRNSAVHHPHIVPFFGVARSDSNIYVISKFMAGHSLFDILRRSAKPFFPETVLKISYQVAQGMEFLHSCGSQFVHGSLKSANVLLDSDLNARVGDCGVAQLKSYAEVVLIQRMSSAWTAPEVLRGAGLSQAADVYSYGVILWELLTRREPHAGKDVDQIRKSVLKEKASLPLPDDCKMDDAYLRLVTECLSHKPGNRPTFTQVLDQLESIDQ